MVVSVTFMLIPCQRVHSRRVLRHALDVYAQKGWSLAEVSNPPHPLRPSHNSVVFFNPCCPAPLHGQDFIGFSLARYSFSLRKLDDASVYFERLLSHECSQSPQQQLTNLKEYIFVQKVGFYS